MRKHPERLKQAGIGPARYAELRAICRGYRDLKRDLERARMGIVDRPRYTSGAWHRPDPTGAEALSLACHPAARRVKLIEDAAMAVAGRAVAPALLECVTQGRQYEFLRHDPCMGRTAFYRLRTDFYVALDAALWEKCQ